MVEIDFLSIMDTFEAWGIYDVVLPFLLIFTLVFAILEKIKIFGQDSQKFNAIIALVLGILLVRQGDLVNFINSYLPNVSVVIVVFLGFLILIGIFKKGNTPLAGGLMLFLTIVSLIGGIWALTAATEGTDLVVPWLDITISESDAGALVVFGILLLIIIIALGKKKKNDGGLDGFMRGLSEIGNSFQK